MSDWQEKIDGVGDAIGDALLYLESAEATDCEVFFRGGYEHVGNLLADLAKAIKDQLPKILQREQEEHDEYCRAIAETERSLGRYVKWEPLVPGHEPAWAWEGRS